MSGFIQNTIIIGGILVIGGLGFLLYTQSGKEAGENGVSSQVAAETESFLRRLNELKAIELNGTIFSDPRFDSLVNYTQPVSREPVGRANPFSI